MAIYSKPVWALMKEMAAVLAPAPESIFSKQQAIDWFSKNYPKIKTGTVTAHLIRLSTNAPTRIHYNAKPGQDDVFFQLDGSHFRLYQPTQDPSPIYTARESTERAQNPEEEYREESADSVGSGQFAYEADLRNYLAKNLSLVESGLQLYEDEGITGIEFPVGGRFIDILATDSTGGLVVIELRVSRGYDRVVGQLMRYMAWIRKNQADSSQRVRGVIVAREISEDLLLACSVVPDVELFEYQLSLSLKRIDHDRSA
jgi:hypothetical protein